MQSKNVVHVLHFLRLFVTPVNGQVDRRKGRKGKVEVEEKGRGRLVKLEPRLCATTEMAMNLQHEFFLSFSTDFNVVLRSKKNEVVWYLIKDKSKESNIFRFILSFQWCFGISWLFYLMSYETWVIKYSTLIINPLSLFALFSSNHVILFSISPTCNLRKSSISRVICLETITNAHKWLIYVRPCPLYLLLLSFHNNKFSISFLISTEYQQFYNFPWLANGKWGTQSNKKHNHNIIMQSRIREIVENEWKNAMNGNVGKCKWNLCHIQML